MLSPGDQVDRYVVERLLGVGGSAQVWQVRHSLLGRRYALKVLPPNPRAAEEQALLAEGQAQAHLEHANILPIRDVFLVRGRLGLLMPLVDGPSLRRLHHRFHLPEAEAVAIVRSVLEGLAYVHDQGMVHCDLKPENILLQIREAGLVPCIADFGLARPTALAVTTGGTETPRRQIGTPGYIAPEQLSPEAPVDHRADLFSVGVVLYELLVGQPPFPGETLKTARQRSLPPDVSALPAAHRALILSLLQADPACRPADARAILAGLPARPDALAPQSASYRHALRQRLPTLDAPVLTPSVDQLSAEIPHNLVRLPDRFLGHEAEVQDVADRLSRGVRLVSVVGIGGVGKSRFAHQILRQVLPRFPGGVWSCDLSAATTLSGLYAAIGQALRIELEDDPRGRIAEALRERRHTILCLDNLEDLVALVPPVLSAWLQAAPEVAFLVTSRVPLQLPEESRLPLGPLGIEDGCSLFFQRAQALGEALDPEHDAAAVRALVEHLDGLPLAITLAASRVPLLSPPLLLERLQARPELLRGTSRATPSRQRSLQGVIAWSWSSVSPAAQRALAQLSLLEGTVSLSLAESIIDLSSLEPPVWVEDVLSELLDASLLQALRRPRQERHLQILSSVRRFARLHLPPAEADATWDRLIQACLGLGFEAAAAEPHHILCAARQALSRRGAAAWPLVQRAHYLLMRLGPFQDAVTLLEQMSPHLPEDSSEPRLALLGCRLWTLRALGHYPEALALAEDLSARAAHVGSTQLWEIAQEYVPLILHSQGDARGAVAHMQAYLTQARTPSAQHRTRINLSNILRELGAYDQALGCLDALPETFRAVVCLNRGAVEADRGHLIVALSHFKTSLQLDHARKDPRSIIISEQNLAEVLMQLGRFPDAERHLREAVIAERALGSRHLRASLLATTGVLHHVRGNLEPAVRCLRECVEIFETLQSATLLAVHRSELAMVLRENNQLPEATALIQRALDAAVAHPTAYTPLIAARAAIIHTCSFDLVRAADALQKAAPPVSLLARITLPLARAVLARRSGFPRKAQQHLKEAAATLLASEHSPQGPLGALFGNLFPDYPLLTVPIYVPTET